MRANRKIFITSSVLLAFIDRANPRHMQATAYMRFFAQEQYFVFTSNQVIIETSETLQKQISPSIAKDFLKAMYVSNIEILRPEESDEKAAMKLYAGYTAHEVTYNQTLISVLADRKGINQICSFDYHQPLLGQTAFLLPV